MVNRDIAFKMYNDGATLQEIGNRFGVSRQRINQIINSTYDTQGHRRTYTAPSPNASEEYVFQKLQSLGYKVEHTNKQSPYDLLLNDKIRVEVKYRSHGEKAYYRIHQLKPNRFDVLIFIAGDQDVAYIIPSSECGRFLTIPVNPIFKTRKQRKYRNNWNLLKSLLTNGTRGGKL